MPCYPSSSCAPQGVARSQTVRQGVFANMSRWFARQVPRHVFAGGLMKVQERPAMPPKTRLTLDAPRSLPTSRWDCQMWLPQDAAMIDCLHAKTGSRSGPGCYCPPCHQDAANFGANLFIYHDIVWRSRAGFFFQVLRELIYTPDFFVYTMRVARVYTCVCICLHIYTPSYWVCMCVCVCMFTCTHTDLHVWVYVCAYICIPMGVYIFLY